MTKGKNNRRRRKVTAFLLALCMVWLMLPPGEARAATPQPEAEVQQTYVDDSTDINAIPAYQPEGDSKILSYVHSEVLAKGDHIARLMNEEYDEEDLFESLCVFGEAKYSDNDEHSSLVNNPVICDGCKQIIQTYLLENCS